MNENWVTITAFDMPIEAHLAKNLLETNGLNAVLVDEFTIGVAWHLSNALGGIKLQVAETDFEGAIAVLEEQKKVTALDAYTPLTSPAKIEKNEGEIETISVTEELNGDKLANRALRAALLGFFILPILHLYSLLLIGRLRFSKQKISQHGHKVALFVGILDLVVLGFSFFPVLWRYLSS